MKPVRIGMITPSSNIVLEPASARILSGPPEVTTHAARIRVTEISLDGAALSQFTPEAFYPCADLLADAHVDAMGWNGTSSSWIGFSADETLSAELSRRYGIPATVQDQRRHVERFQVGGEVGLGEGFDAVIGAFEAREHSL